MRILIAPDKFKGSATASEVARWLKEGIVKAEPNWQIELLPLADGGEGTAEIMGKNLGARCIWLEVDDPLGRTIQAAYYYEESQKLAIIEMAAASGLALLRPEEKTPLKTSTYGTGQLILNAIRQGAKEILLGIGGSATNDMGTGMAAALNSHFKDKNKMMISPCGENLGRITDIDIKGLQENLRDTSVKVACDVTNPLYGPEGAAYVYAPQKGATREQVEILDKGLKHLAGLIREKHGIDLQKIPGAGAAGGMGAGAVFFLNARLKPGFELIASALRLHEKIGAYDVIVTGEGCFDRTSLQGKVAGRLLHMKGTHQRMAIICGISELRAAEVADLDFLLPLHQLPLKEEGYKQSIKDDLYKTGQLLVERLRD